MRQGGAPDAAQRAAAADAYQPLLPADRRGALARAALSLLAASSLAAAAWVFASSVSEGDAAIGDSHWKSHASVAARGPAATAAAVRRRVERVVAAFSSTTPGPEPELARARERSSPPSFASEKEKVPARNVTLDVAALSDYEANSSNLSRMALDTYADGSMSGHLAQRMPLPVAGVYVINLPVHRDRFFSFLDDFCPKTGVDPGVVQIVDGVNATEALQQPWPSDFLPGVERNPTRGQIGQLGLALAHMSAWKAVRDSPECRAGQRGSRTWHGPLRGDILGWGYAVKSALTLQECRQHCEDDSVCEAVQFSESAVEGIDRACIMHNNASAWRPQQHLFKDHFMHFLIRTQASEDRYALVFEDDEKVQPTFKDTMRVVIQATRDAAVKPDFINLNCLRPNGDVLETRLPMPNGSRVQVLNKERDYENQCWDIRDWTCPNVWMGAYMVRCGGADSLLRTMFQLEYGGSPYTGTLTFDRAVADMQLRRNNSLTTWVVSPSNSVALHSEAVSDRMAINKGNLRRMLV